MGLPNNKHLFIVILIVAVVGIVAIVSTTGLFSWSSLSFADRVGSANARGISPANNAACAYSSFPNTVTPGQQFSALVAMRNTGTKAWTSNLTNPYGLGSQNPQDNVRWGVGRVGLPYAPVQPNTVVYFNFTATAPATPGVYPFDWEMVQEYVQWFGQTCSATINVSYCTPLCPAAYNVVCGQVIMPTNGCGNCTGKGTHCRAGSCNGQACTTTPICILQCPVASTVACGQAINPTNGCGTCAGTGTRCPSGQDCQSGQCVAPLAAPITISFWCAPPYQKTSVAEYQRIKYAGFTVIMPPCEGDATIPNIQQTILDSAQAVGLKAYIAEYPRITKYYYYPNLTIDPADLDGVVADYSHHPAFAGYWITDEPSAGNFTRLAAIVDGFRQRDPTHPSYINLFGNGAPAYRLGTPDYPSYLNLFITTVHPAQISYDNYPLRNSAGYKPGFLQNLEQVRSAAEANGIPFWQILQSWSGYNVFRAPTRAEDRWQAMQTLAFGAKGIMWFYYWQPSYDPKFGPGLLDKDGNRVLYDDIKAINAEIQAVGKYLAPAAHIATYTSSNIPYPDKVAPPTNPLVTVTGTAQVTIGTFSDASRKYALVANSLSSGSAILCFPAGAQVQSLNISTNTWSAVGTTANACGQRVTRSYGVGDATLYRW